MQNNKEKVYTVKEILEEVRQDVKELRQDIVKFKVRFAGIAVTLSVITSYVYKKLGI